MNHQFGFDFWQLVLFCSMLIGGFFGVIQIAFRFYDREIEKRFSHLEEALAELKTQHHDLSRDVIRREDWVRHVAQNERAMDRLQLTLDAMQQQLRQEAR